MTTEATPTEPTTQEPKQNSFPWWVAVLIGLAGIGVGVGATFINLKKK